RRCAAPDTAADRVPIVVVAGQTIAAVGSRVAAMSTGPAPGGEAGTAAAPGHQQLPLVVGHRRACAATAAAAQVLVGRINDRWGTAAGAERRLPRFARVGSDSDHKRVPWRDVERADRQATTAASDLVSAQR